MNFESVSKMEYRHPFRVYFNVNKFVRFAIYCFEHWISIFQIIQCIRWSFLGAFMKRIIKSMSVPKHGNSLRWAVRVNLSIKHITRLRKRRKVHTTIFLPTTKDFDFSPLIELRFCIIFRKYYKSVFFFQNTRKLITSYTHFFFTTNFYFVTNK